MVLKFCKNKVVVWLQPNESCTTMVYAPPHRLLNTLLGDIPPGGNMPYVYGGVPPVALMVTVFILIAILMIIGIGTITETVAVVVQPLWVAVTV